MTRQACLRDRWRTAVLGSHLITDSTRVVLLFLADKMAANGYVSVPRSEIADALNRAPRRITERIELAREAGFLDTVARGRPGKTAEYRACIPPSGMVRPSAPSEGPSSRSTYGAVSSTHSGAPGRTTQLGAPGGPANTRARGVPTASVSEHLALHNPSGAQDANTEVSTASRCVDRYGQLHSTRQVGTRLTRMVESPHGHGGAETHDLTRRLRAAGVSPLCGAFAFRAGFAA